MSNENKKSQQKRLRVDIPSDLDLDRVYNPRYPVLQLMSTRRKPRPAGNPPRPPNSYFLLKNCYMLEVRSLGLKYTMPELCIQSRRVWKECPQEVKDRYEVLQHQVQCIHNELYPGYKFRPKKRKTFKMHVFPDNNKMSDNISSFSTTNYLNSSPSDYLPSESECSPVIPGEDFGPKTPETLETLETQSISSSSDENTDSSAGLENEMFEVSQYHYLFDAPYPSGSYGFAEAPYEVYTYPDEWINIFTPQPYQSIEFRNF
ncbi:10085_t:CDS:1 [Acaulospora morrowiae]|uniref:10085_t:CDS:1 n=1 Tax=Acaulospora morrowiae TaxID=94023 RepID=A0A9N9BC99_9GLOM|nr:10085_t:CDS:1 [Acaulospora morrowiae]